MPVRDAYCLSLRVAFLLSDCVAFLLEEGIAHLSHLAIEWILIGHLQTNKARYVARFATELQSLDGLKLAEALQRRLELEARQLDVMAQVNTSGEPSKYGLPPEQVAGLLRELPVFSALRVRGLMTLALFSSDEARPPSAWARPSSGRARCRIPTTGRVHSRPHTN